MINSTYQNEIIYSNIKPDELINENISLEDKESFRIRIDKLVKLGESSRSTFCYSASSINRILFKYNFACIYDIDFLFMGEDGNYNEISLPFDKSKWYHKTRNLIKNISTTLREVSIYFIDIDTNKTSEHSTLLIYRKDENSLTYYDPYGCDNKISIDFMSYLAKKLPNKIFISSKEVHDVNGCWTISDDIEKNLLDFS